MAEEPLPPLTAREWAVLARHTRRQLRVIVHQLNHVQPPRLRARLAALDARLDAALAREPARNARNRNK